MTEKSPIDTLNSIYDLLSTLHSRMSLLEKSVALLHEKANGNIGVKMPIPLVSNGSHPELDKSPTLGVQRIQAGSGNSSKAATPPQSNQAKVHGSVLGPDKKPLASVSVLIKNQKGDTAKQLKTDRTGTWSTMLPPGKYAITYTRERMTPIYRFVEVKAGQQDLEVA